MKYILFVSCSDHVDVLKDFFSGYVCEERKANDNTILSYNISPEDDKKFFELYKQSLTCRNNGIKVCGVRVP